MVAGLARHRAVLYNSNRNLSDKLVYLISREKIMYLTFKRDVKSQIVVNNKILVILLILAKLLKKKHDIMYIKVLKT